MFTNHEILDRNGSAGATDSNHPLEDSDGILDVVQRVPTDDDVERVLSKRQRVGIPPKERDVVYTLVGFPRCRNLERGFGEVDPDDVRTNVRESEGDVSRASCDLENSLVGRRPGHFQ